MSTDARPALSEEATALATRGKLWLGPARRTHVSARHTLRQRAEAHQTHHARLTADDELGDPAPSAAHGTQHRAERRLVPAPLQVQVHRLDRHARVVLRQCLSSLQRVGVQLGTGLSACGGWNGGR